MKYRRIEVNAVRRRITIVSGESPVVDIEDLQPACVHDDVSLTDTDSCEPVEPDSSEGQMILVEAVRSLERRLSPETRAASWAVQEDPALKPTDGLRRKLQSLYQLIHQWTARSGHRGKKINKAYR